MTVVKKLEEIIRTHAKMKELLEKKIEKASKKETKAVRGHGQTK